MPIVKMHQASDGSLFKTYEEFAAHEGALKIRAALQQTKLNLNTFVAGKKDELAFVLPEDDVSDFIVANADALRKILGAGVVVKRGRSAKNATPAV